MSRILLLSLALLLASCAGTKQNAGTATAKMPFVWENANLYFLLTDRFNNGNPANDLNFGRTNPTAPKKLKKVTSTNSASPHSGLPPW